MNNELLLILNSLGNSDEIILSTFCFSLNCQNIECEVCIFNRLKYRYLNESLNVKYIKTIEVVFEQ